MTASEIASAVDALAKVALKSLEIGMRLTGQNPTLHDITCAVVNAAPLFDLNTEPEAIEIEIEVVRRVCERHNWHGIDVIVLPRR